MTQMATQRRFAVPVWFAVVIILLATGGGGWFLYRYMTGPKSSSDTIVVGRGAPNARPRSAGEAEPSTASRWGFGGPVEGIDRRGSGRVTIRRGDGVVRATLDKGAYKISFDYLYAAKQAWVTPAQWDLHRLALRIVDEPGFAPRLGVTPGQVQQLKTLTYTATITDAEQKKLSSLILAWDKATAAAKDTAGTDLLAAVAELTKSHLAETKAAMAKRAADIPTILTTQQIDQARGNSTTRPAGG